MFLALYFATEEDERPVAGNDNDPVLADGWYIQARQRLIDRNRPWNDAHTAALPGAPVR